MMRHTLKEERVVGINFCKSRKKIFVTFKENVTGIKCGETSKIKMPREFKATNCWKQGKSD